MGVKVEATIDDLLKVKQKAEIVNGEIILMSPTGSLPGYAGDATFSSLREYSKRKKYGRAVGDNKAFVVNLPHRKSFSPDAAFHVGRDGGMKLYQDAPVFAVEVRSEGDYGSDAERQMAEKRADYFAAGTLVVWDVDLLSEEVVRVYRSSDPENPSIYRRGQIAEAETGVPGWIMSVNDLFPDICEVPSAQLKTLTTTPMSTKVEATIEDLYKVEGKAEPVNGEIVLMPGTGGFPHLAALEITLSLAATKKRLERAMRLEITRPLSLIYHIVNLLVRTQGFTSETMTMRFFDGAPVFAVEVRSENDYGPSAERRMAKKRDDYFACGTLVVWDVDLLSEDVVRVYRCK